MDIPIIWWIRTGENGRRRANAQQTGSDNKTTEGGYEFVFPEKKEPEHSSIIIN